MTGHAGDPVPPPAPPAVTGWGGRIAELQRRLVRLFPLHVRLFLALNIALSIVNAVMGRPWWAFWPLLVTGLALAAHYLVYKTAVVDDAWAEERTEDINLKSYDRGHIENLKSRFEEGEIPPDPPR